VDDLSLQMSAEESLASEITARGPIGVAAYRIAALEAEDRERHQERIRSGPRTQPEGDIERVALRTRQALTEFEDRRAQLLDAGEREPHLVLDPGAPDDPQRRGLLDRVLEQRRLADARLAMDDERSTESIAGGVHQAVKGRSFAFPAQ
jgi:hypothetical protein